MKTKRLHFDGSTFLKRAILSLGVMLLMFMGMSAQQTHLVVPIVDGFDDVEEWDTGEVNRTSSDLELYWDNGIQVVGVLFRDVQLPTDVVIDSSYIQFISKTDAAAAIEIQINGVDSATVVSITGEDFAVSGKASTTATVAWSPEAWVENPYPYEAVEAERTPELTTIISEITANAGWAAGNNMMFKLTGTVDENANRNVFAYEDGASVAPVLHIFYSPKDGIVERAKTDKGPEADGSFYKWEDDDAKWGLQFDAHTYMTLLSVKVYNGVTELDESFEGDRTFTVISAADDTIASATVNVALGEQRLILNMSIPAGTGYRLIADSHVGLWRDKTSANENYPYAVGDIATVTGDIKWDGGSVTTTQYHFFYDWDVEEVETVKGAKTDKGPEANGEYYPWEDEGARFGLEFDALKDMQLLSVKVFNGLAFGGELGVDGATYEGERTISVLNADQDTIASTRVFVVPGEQRLILNMSLPAGTGYRLISDSHVGFWRDQTDPDELFPYAVGDIVSIISDLGFDARNQNTTQYHFFYDWEVIAVSANTAELTAGIAASKAVIAGVTVGDADGEYTQAKVDAANAAVAAAEASLASATTQAEVDQATADLNTAMELFVANDSTAVGKALNENFGMYPNPVIDILVLENISNVNSISIFSLTGKKLKSISNFNNTLNIDLSDLNSGVYIIKFIATDGVSAKSLIKQ